ncbi:hypothetical protein PIB30_042061 [Stylosanthes scabra]|uniref:Putative plant transposon protein domain-containing protein n=1 Tax=Stylosanthes scabra TaxID=79078 RepID=A0ABU6YDG5_9FABA|nr:hypothetical protein [Stylosanthes scabra]
MVKEFYANAWEPEKDKRKPYTYTTMVQGKDISFAPKDIKRVLKLRKDPLPNVGSYHERKASKDYRLEEVQERLFLEGREWVRHRDGMPHYLRRNDLDPMAKDLSSSLPFPGIIAALCLDAKVVTLKDDTLIPQELPIVGEVMVRVREPRARNPRANQARQDAPQQQQQPPQEQPQPQVQQQEFPSNFYTHFDNSMSMIYRRLDSQQEESRKSFEALNTRMNRFDDQLSYLCYSTQMTNEQMPSPYQEQQDS